MENRAAVLEEDARTEVNLLAKNEVDSAVEMRNPNVLSRTRQKVLDDRGRVVDANEVDD